MFDIGFWELVLISVVALVVLGPERLPHAIRSVTKFIGAAKSMANSVKDELAHELKVQELQENLRKAEQMGMKNLSPELQESVDKLKQAAQDVQRPYAASNNTQTADNSAATSAETMDVSESIKGSETINVTAQAQTQPTEEELKSADKKAE
ncbi:Sec-independent protein translocase protein TatB [Vibrio plantisponsor]|uniref:Sec-independent protein translocase protein TatB n=1 Tax=Vibrio plantisponsor TaxID=664643 RepID=A0ABU4IIL8_9VIBR|nr:Sec-independent protein translocase protein TatB [Vibrio plantisponsor]MDW6018402.1 Sec-independent protein translocase protein TatB [Vibrio plantisponsor]NNM41793.1 Sec-independent protein translocase subunit TatB [Vibrio plantisponsor]